MKSAERYHTFHAFSGEYPETDNFFELPEDRPVNYDGIPDEDTELPPEHELKFED